MQPSGDGCSDCPKGAGQVSGGPEHPSTGSSSLCLRSQVADVPYKLLRHRFSVGRFLWVRGAPHVQASGNECSKSPKGSGRVSGGPEHPPTCSSRLCVRPQVADAPYKYLRHRFSVERFLVGEGCATRASVRGRINETSKGCWSDPWGSGASADMQQQLCFRLQVADAPYKCLSHRFSVGMFLVGEGRATRASIRGRMQRTSKKCWSGPWGFGASADMQQQPLPLVAGG